MTDSINSWFISYGNKLTIELIKLKHDVKYVFDKSNIREGDVCFILSCSKIIEKQYLKRNKNNIVVHASDLPSGKGFSPLQWQILENKNDIILTLFEAVEEVDAGPYYIKEKLSFDGTELYEELRYKLAQRIIDMCIYYVMHINEITAIPQMGIESFYRKRTKNDDEIDPNKTINELFNHFRIADNEIFPLFFYYKGKKYFLKIYNNKADD